ncbi:uncharacterized protein LOC125939855 [Dermacentor silvarum]|uniref:uncharacterized protein LOC125939855 n=1 Tax=Dermacentor silvarum TaxID=543639 RepID=UPI002101AECB|nr:uncharacterized protein LOC125939855 [Dermacentor silvarum]
MYQDYPPEIGDYCHSMQKQYPYGKHSLVYNFRFLDYSILPGFLIAFNTTLTTSITTHHPRENAATYRICNGCLEYKHKLMFTDTYKDCFILIQNLYAGGKGCQLLLREHVVNKKISTECERVFKKNCRGKKFNLYKDECNTYSALGRHMGMAVMGAAQSSFFL